MSRRNDGPGGMIPFGFGDPRFGTWGGDGILLDEQGTTPTVATPKPQLPRDVDDKISKMRIAVLASEKAVREAERQLKADKADLAELLAKYGLPPEY